MTKDSRLPGARTRGSHAVHRQYSALVKKESWKVSYTLRKITQSLHPERNETAVVLSTKEKNVSKKVEVLREHLEE